MSKSKRRAEIRRAAVDPVSTPDAEAVELPEAWKKRPWVPYSIMAIVIAAVVGSGLALQQAVTQPRATALAGCKTSTAVGVHAFISAQPICIIPNHKYTATLNTTQGKIVIELLPDTAPVTVNNFIVLALNGYYNGSSFWDSEDWVVQAGDPNGNGTGGPGYNLPEEPASFLKWNPGRHGANPRRPDQRQPVLHRQGHLARERADGHLQPVWDGDSGKRQAAGDHLDRQDQLDHDCGDLRQG